MSDCRSLCMNDEDVFMLNNSEQSASEHFSGDMLITSFEEKPLRLISFFLSFLCICSVQI